jgi:hypothetical protein
MLRLAVEGSRFDGRTRISVTRNGSHGTVVDVVDGTGSDDEVDVEVATGVDEDVEVEVEVGAGIEDEVDVEVELDVDDVEAAAVDVVVVELEVTEVEVSVVVEVVVVSVLEVDVEVAAVVVVEQDIFLRHPWRTRDGLGDGEHALPEQDGTCHQQAALADSEAPTRRHAAQGATYHLRPRAHPQALSDRRGDGSPRTSSPRPRRSGLFGSASGRRLTFDRLRPRGPTGYRERADRAGGRKRW